MEEHTMGLKKQLIGIITSAAILSSMSPADVIAYDETAEKMSEDACSEIIRRNGKSLFDIDDIVLLSADCFEESGVNDALGITEESIGIAEDSAEIVEQGSYGDNITYALDADGVLTFTGTGEMSDFTNSTLSQNPFYKKEGITKIIVGNGITAIGQYDFLSCPDTETVIISDTVTSIHSGAFRNNKSLTSVSLGEGIQTILSYGFDLCSALTDVYYAGSPSQWAKVSIETKNDPLLAATVICAKEDVILPCGDNLTWSFDAGTGTLTITGEGEMYGWSADDAESIPWIEIAGNIKNVVIDDGVTSIGDNAFSLLGYGIETFTIGSGVKTIGEQALPAWYCLIDVTYNGMRDEWASINIADSNCIEYREVRCADDETEPEPTADPDIDPAKCGAALEWTLADGALTITGEGAMYNLAPNGGTMPWNGSAEQITDIVIGDGVTAIGSYAFADCVDLVNVTIPQSVKKIGAGAFGNNNVIEKLSCYDREWFEGIEIESGNLRLTFADEIDYEIPASEEIQIISVCTAEDLDKIRDGIMRRPDYCDNKKFTLENDIDLEGAAFEPIGAYVMPDTGESDCVFNAEFDGNGHTVSNFIIRPDSDSYSNGFFAAVNDGGSIKNLTLDNVVSGGRLIDGGWSGIVAGAMYSSGADAAEPSIENCAVQNSLLAESSGSVCFAGGIVGRMLSGSVDGCTVGNVTVETESGSYSYVGGIAGHLYCGTVSGCESGAVIENDTYLYAGSIAGCMGAAGLPGEYAVIDGCTVSSEARVSYNSAMSSATVGIGGIAGFISSGIVMNSVSSASICADCAGKIFAGGIAGYSPYLISGCASSAVIEVKSEALAAVGGIAGRSEGSVSGCETANANIRGLSVSKSSVLRVGGIAGDLTSFTGDITDCKVHDGSVYASSEYWQTQTGGIVAACFGRATGCDVYNTSIEGSSGTTGLIGGISAVLGASDQKADNGIPAYSDIRIEDCTYKSEGAEMNLYSKGIGVAGGISGLVYAPAPVRGCCASFDNNVTTSTDNQNVIFGGIVGRSYTTEIEHCITDGSVSIGDATSVGGILGSVSAYVPYVANADGVYEKADAAMSVNECLSELDINATGVEIRVGGIVGYLNGQLEGKELPAPVVTNSAALGDISFQSSDKTYSFVGGAIGYIIDSKVTDCYAGGSIHETGVYVCDITDEAERTGVDIGGFAGSLKEYQTTAGYPVTEATNCFAREVISVDTNDDSDIILTGGFASTKRDNSVTDNPLSPVLTSCYYYSDIADNSIGVKLKDEQLPDKSTYSGFDFATRWYMSDNGAQLRLERADVCGAVYMYDNNIVSGIESVTLSKPSEINMIYIELTTIIGGKEYGSRTIELPVEATDERTLFSTIDCNIEFDAYEQITNVYTNLTVPSEPCVKITAYYDDAGALIDLEIEETTTDKALPQTSENGIKVMYWNSLDGMKPVK